MLEQNDLCDRRTRYESLVNARKMCFECAPELSNPAKADRSYDSDQIGPWSRWQGNLNAELMVVGQDWGDVGYFKTFHGHDFPGTPTNCTLRALLESINVSIDPPSMRDDGGGKCFFTNAVLCLKGEAQQQRPPRNEVAPRPPRVGGLQAPVSAQCFQNCQSFLERTIEIIRPKVLVTLGERAYAIVARLNRLQHLQFRQAVDREDGFTLKHGVAYLPMYHCGARILNTHRPIEQQLRDWQRVGRALSRSRPC